MAITAQPLTYTAIGGSVAFPVPVVVLNDAGNPVIPDSYAIVTPPTNGTAVANGQITYQPTVGTIATGDSFIYTATLGGVTSAPALVAVQISANYNCDCDDDFPTYTLAQLQRRILVRLGYAAMATPPPGMAELVNDFLYQAQTFLYRRYRCFRTTRWFTWQTVAGQRFYDINGNLDACTKKLDPRRVQWVGISRGDKVWNEMIEGINPAQYTSKFLAIPQFYEVRSCIEVWPAPNDESWLLRIKGDFGLLPFVNPSDVTTIDAEAVFMYALANAKAHYQQPDAQNCMAECNTYIGDLIAGTRSTHRAWPGGGQIPNAIPPKMVP